MITIKLFGEGCYVNLLESSVSSIKIYKDIAASMKLPLEEALLDLFFYHKLKTDIHNVNDLVIDSFGGLLSVATAYIEVWFKRRKKAKIFLKDLVFPMTLFPLYKVDLIPMKSNDFEKGIYLKETVIGCIGVYKIKSDNFYIDDFNFKILDSFFTKDYLLIEFTYKGELLKKIKEDCLTRSQEIIRI